MHSGLEGPPLLLINPWIEDFAAYDFFARPLGLLYLAGVLAAQGYEIHLIDCLGGLRLYPTPFGTGRYPKQTLPPPPALQGVARRYGRYGIPESAFREQLARVPAPAAILVTSLMTYWYPGVNAAIRLARKHFPRVPVILGGIYATLCPEHARRHSGADLVVTGPGEGAIGSILEDLLGSQTSDSTTADSILGRDAQATSRLPESKKPFAAPGNIPDGGTGKNSDFPRSAGELPISAEPSQTAAVLPSPLRGEGQGGGEKVARCIPPLDSLPYPALHLLPQPAFIPILTSRGCPLHCSYCASRQLQSRYQRRQPRAVVAELLHWQDRLGLADVAFYDDALLVDAENHLLVILEELAGLGRIFRFHTPNGLHARLITPRVARWLKRAPFATLRLGVETTALGPTRPDRKLAAGELEAALAHLKEAGFNQNQMGVYLLLGLPDQDDGELEISIRRVRELDATPILAQYSPIPGTALWPQAVQSSRYDLEGEPLYHNNSLFPCWPEFSWPRFTHLKRMALGQS
jgi:radical SAM superfamily enzyme YgiQ (UPF0313 family)